MAPLPVAVRGPLRVMAPPDCAVRVPAVIAGSARLPAPVLLSETPVRDLVAPTDPFSTMLPAVALRLTSPATTKLLAPTLVKVCTVSPPTVVTVPPIAACGPL